MHPDEIRERVTAAADGNVVERWVAAQFAGSLDAPEPHEPDWSTGAAATDAAIDEGAGAILLVDTTTPGVVARAIAAIYCGLDASGVVRTSDDDLTRMESMTRVRDAMPELRAVVTEPLELLQHDALLAWHTAVITHAAVRRTPVVLAGALPHVAALCAQRVSTACVSWVHWGIASDDAVAVAARTRLAREPWFTTTLPLDRDTMIAILRAAVADLTAQE